MNTRPLVALTFAVTAAFGSATIAHAQVRLYAAGSLRAAMTEIGRAFADAGNSQVEFEFGASGLLRDRLAKGERADVFASANMEHPASLAAAAAQAQWRCSPATGYARCRAPSFA